MYEMTMMMMTRTKLLSTMMANMNDLLIVSYMRGYFQGIEVAKDLVNSAKSPDRIAAFGQECVFALERNKGRYC